MIAASEIKAIGMKDEKLTVGEKVVLHLGEYVNSKDLFVTPFAITQDGVAVACDISRAHASIELKKLKGKGIVEMRNQHVSGCRTKRRVYFLTKMGVDELAKITERTGVEPRDVLFPQNRVAKGTRDPILDQCFRKVLRCALEMHRLRDENIPNLTDVETELLEVVKTLCRK